MSNLNKNTTQLEALLAKVNALPEASSGGTDTSDATATADEIFAGETAYTADGKVTGTFTIEEELTEQNDLITQIAALVATKANPQGGGIETCYCLLGCDLPTMDQFTATYTNASMQSATRQFDSSGTRIEVAKGTIVAISPWSSTSGFSGDCSKIFASASGGAYFIAGDSTMAYG